MHGINTNVCLYKWSGEQYSCLCLNMSNTVGGGHLNHYRKKYTGGVSGFSIHTWKYPEVACNRKAYFYKGTVSH